MPAPQNTFVAWVEWLRDHGGLDNDVIMLEGWGPTAARPQVTLVSPNGQSYGPVEWGAERSFISDDGDVSIFNSSNPARLPDEDTTRSTGASWFIVTVSDHTSLDHHPAPGRWTLRLSPPLAGV